MNSKIIIGLIGRPPLNKFANLLHTMSNCKSKGFNHKKEPNTLVDCNENHTCTIY